MLSIKQNSVNKTQFKSKILSPFLNEKIGIVKLRKNKKLINKKLKKLVSETQKNLKNYLLLGIKKCF